MNKVLIMLSTYNGQKYICEQLDSLYAQKGVDIHILVRDDGSKDSTVDVLKEYQLQYGKMTIHADENLGAAMSFHKLMSYAYKEFPNYEYYAFSDQDDVWLEDKLYAAAEQLSANNGDLYYCNAIITDSNMNIIRELGCEHNLSLQYLMFRQPALGCTQVMICDFFKSCAKLSIQYIAKVPFHVEMHDAWTMWISQAVGAKVVVDQHPHMFYRQHGNNVTSHNRENAIQKMKRVSKRAKEHRGAFFENLSILYSFIPSKLTPEASLVFEKLLKYKYSLYNTVCFALYMQKYFKDMNIKFMVMYYILNRFY